MKICVKDHQFNTYEIGNIMLDYFKRKLSIFNNLKIVSLCRILDQIIDHKIYSVNNYKQNQAMKRYKQFDDLQKLKNQDTNSMPRHNRSNSFYPKRVHEQFSNDGDSISDGSFTVYIRSSQKKGFKMKTTGKLQLNQIKDAIHQHLQIQYENQIIYINGKNVSKYRSLQLHHHEIIHVCDAALVCDSDSNIFIKLKVVSQKSENESRQYQFNVQSKTKVGEFIQMLTKDIQNLKQYVNSPQIIYLFESSRILDRQKTFLEQNISKYTQIICFSSRNDIKINFTNDTKEDIINDINELMGFDNEDESKAQVSKPKRYSDYDFSSNFVSSGSQSEKSEKNVIIQDIEVRRETIEIDSPQKQLNNSQSLPNFKKKSNAYMYSSPGDLSEKISQKPLATKIRSSKTKTQIQTILNSKPNGLITPFEVQAPQVEIRPNSDSKVLQVHKPDPVIPKIMPINQRRKIRLEMEKLFDFDSAENRQDNLQQIPILQTNFMEENAKIELSSLQEIKPNEVIEEKPLQKIQQKCKPLEFRNSFSSRPKFLNFLNKNNFS